MWKNSVGCFVLELIWERVIVAIGINVWVYFSTYVLIKMLHYKSFEFMNFYCIIDLNCKIFGWWLYSNACLLYNLWGIFFLLQHMTWPTICMMLSSWLLMNIILMLDEIIVKRGEEIEKVQVFQVKGNSFFSKGGEVFFWIFEHSDAFYHFLFLIFQTPKHFWWVWQCVHQGGYCKIKVCLIILWWWTIGIWDYWFWYLEIIGKVVLEMIGFLQVIDRDCCCWVQSDRAVNDEIW